MSDVAEAVVTDSREAKTARRSRPSASVVTHPRAEPPVARVKVTVDLSWEAYERLQAHRQGTGLTQAKIVEDLINENLRRFVVVDRGSPKGDKDAA